MKNYHLV